MVLAGIQTVPSMVFFKFGKFKNFKGGPLLDSRIVWSVMESPNLFAFLFAYLGYFGPVVGSVSNANLILAGMMLYHYIYRTLIYPFRLSRASKVPLSIGISAFLYTSWNGWNQAYSLLISPDCVRSDNEIYQPHFIIGCVIFIVGWYINYQSDLILIRLRGPKDTGYKIPRGGMFEYVCCAHYFGEIVEWIGYAIACWHIHGVSFSFFVVCNLAPRATQVLNWYHSKFEDFPRHIKAVFPFVL